MHLKSIINRLTNYKPFVIQHIGWSEASDEPVLRVQMAARRNGRAVCSGCHEPRPGYDRMPERSWEFVPLWQIPVIFVYALRRVNCPQCGIKGTRPFSAQHGAERPEAVAALSG